MRSKVQTAYEGDWLLRVSAWWRERASNCIAAVTIARGRVSTISAVRVSSQWPLYGSITFTRDHDGKRYRVWHDSKRGTFRVEPVR